ncbi:MAG: L-seryl-tRNA(Sec) selenium transferase [Pseudomonadota bacterium]
MDTTANRFRELPSVDGLLRLSEPTVGLWGQAAVTVAIREELTNLRAALAEGQRVDLSPHAILEQVANRLARADAPTLKPVFNLTGTVLHTNLGRAPLAESALQAVETVAGGASNLEFDLQAGERGDRDSHVEALVCELTGAEAATVVNNNAAAVLLVLNTLALGREVPVSRGELVEIGGSFRIPEVMSRSGCTLVEIGATNRTHPKDYQQAINERTALLMKVHTSNYAVQGFTAEVSEVELADIARQHALPLVIDLGSGNLVDFGRLGLPAEPTAAAALSAGADIVCFSGDKLLGGPQAGLIAGRKDLVAQVKRNPLKRALRADKMTLAALAATLKLYRDPKRLVEELPALRLLTRPPVDIRATCDALLNTTGQALGSAFEVSVADCHSQIGSGSLPIDTLPSSALHCRPVDGQDSTLRQLVNALRGLPIPVIGRVHRGALWLDLRCLESAQQAAFMDQVGQLTL